MAPFHILYQMIFQNFKLFSNLTLKSHRNEPRYTNAVTTGRRPVKLLIFCRRKC